jgi:hypothetical protein
MAPSTVNATSFDPYRRFRFRVRWNDADILGVSKVSGLTRTTTPVKHRDGARTQPLAKLARGHRVHPDHP